jgi:uncharacterized protein (DUF2461 family)
MFWIALAIIGCFAVAAWWRHVYQEDTMQETRAVVIPQVAQALAREDVAAAFMDACWTLTAGRDLSVAEREELIREALDEFREAVTP